MNYTEEKKQIDVREQMQMYWYFLMCTKTNSGIIFFTYLYHAKPV